MVGQVFLQKYKITRLLDQGGMSKIYLARQAPDREVVVKVLKDELLASTKAQEHFRREIHILSRFQHPQACAYIDSTPNDAKHGPVLVMEYVRGLDLNLLIQRQGKMNVERVGRLLAQLCEVLQAAHDAGIVHRDLKPGNLMVVNPGTPQESIKLMDFGLARMRSMLYISAEEIVDWRLPGAAGTPEYICPEQVRGSEMDGRGDLYSVGVILFEMLAGKRPFDSNSVEELLQAHADEPPPTFADLGLPNLVPPGVEEVIRSCLEKHPDQRPANAAELILRFERAVGKRLMVRRPTTMKTSSGTAPTALAGPPAAADRNAVIHRVEATMPEAMAMLKLKGFVHDLGGAVVESVPGLIRVRVPDAKPSAKKAAAGLFGWMERGKEATAVASAGATNIELHMERRDPAQPSKLTITLIMRSAGGIATAEWRNRCQQIGRDLGAYLMGR